MFNFLLVLCIICVKSTISLLQYSTVSPTVLVGFLRLSLLDIGTNWTMNRLSEENLSVVCRGLTIMNTYSGKYLGELT